MMSALADGIKVKQDESEIIEQQLSTSIINQVLKVLEDGYDKLKVALMIPQALNTPDFLEQYLSEDEITILMHKCKSYFDDPIDEENDEDFTLSYHLSKIIEFLYYDIRFRKHVLMYDVKETSKLSNFFVKQIEGIFYVAALRLQTPASVDLLREKLVQEAFRENERLKENIIACRKQLSDKEDELEKKIDEGKGTMNAYKGNLDEAYTTYQVEVKKAREDNCQKIIQITAASDAAQERLKIETEKAISNYKNVLRENLAEEKKTREKKQRVLAQLSALIEKYDNDMVERTMEINKIKDQTVLKAKELENFMIVFKKKQEEYAEIFKDVDDEDEETKRQAKIWNFQMNHAAKVIQKAWRVYRATKKKKKGKGKGKAKPKDKAKGAKEKKEPAKKAEPKGKGKKSKKAKVDSAEKTEVEKEDENATEKQEEGEEAEAEKQGEEEQKEATSKVITEKQEESEEVKEAGSEAVAEKQEESEAVNAEETKEAGIEKKEIEETQEDKPQEQEEDSKGKAKEGKGKAGKKKKK